MSPDTLSVVLRGASFVALFQAAGMAMFVAIFGRQLELSLPQIRRIAKIAAIGAVVLLIGQYGLEAARMADDMAGILDPALQMLAIHSTSSVVLALRVLGLGVIFVTIGRGDVGSTLSILAAALVLTSFVLIGHTVTNPLRWGLAFLLIVHVTIVAFWFGALYPLYLASTLEAPIVVSTVTESFSTVAGRLVPLIFVAGLLVAISLLRDWAEFLSPYGIAILFKATGFGVLMGIAALNKWRLAPALASGDSAAGCLFRKSLMTEFVLITAVLIVTATMTTLYSPDT